MARWVAALPLAFLALARVPEAGVLEAVVVTLVAGGLIVWLTRDLFGLALATVGAVAVDTLHGATWMLASPLGYSFNAGLRYYGIGNEYEGVVLGAALVAAGLSVDRGYPRTLVAAALGGIVVILGWPGIGSNFGALAAAGAGLVAFWSQLSGRRVRRWLAVGALPALVALLGGATLFDVWHGGAAATHVGQAALVVWRSGAPALGEIVRRKLGMELELARSVAWRAVLLVPLASLALAALHPLVRYRRLGARQRGLAAGLGAVLVATVVNLAVNDSGAVAAVMTSVFALAVLCDPAARADSSACRGSAEGDASPGANGYRRSGSRLV